MKNKVKLAMLILFLLTFFGCDGNYTNVKITGFVKSTKEQVPIINAQVLIKCWVYSTKTWDSSLVEKTVISDEKGYFEAVFEKGEAFDLIVSADNYKTKEEGQTLKRNKTELTLFLDKK
jgi:hypothetical protein